MKMPLQLDIHIAAAKQSNQLLNLLSGFFHSAMPQSSGQRPIPASRQADEPARMLFQFLFPNLPFAFPGAQLHLGDKTAKILITRAGGNKKRKTERIANR